MLLLVDTSPSIHQNENCSLIENIQTKNRFRILILKSPYLKYKTKGILKTLHNTKRKIRHTFLKMLQLFDFRTQQYLSIFQTKYFYCRYCVGHFWRSCFGAWIQPPLELKRISEKLRFTARIKFNLFGRKIIRKSNTRKPNLKCIINKVINFF